SRRGGPVRRARAPRPAPGAARRPAARADAAPLRRLPGGDARARRDPRALVRPPRHRLSTASLTRARTPVPGSYGARYELGTNVRAHRPAAYRTWDVRHRAHELAGWLRPGRGTFDTGRTDLPGRPGRRSTHATSYPRTQLVRCTLRARHERTSSPAGGVPDVGRST